MASDVIEATAGTAAAARHLYVHVPFCAHRCGYCDFVTASEMPGFHTRYVRALLSELASRTVEGQRFATIHIGGGTPTLLHRDDLRLLLRALAERLAPGAEFAIEANPETVDPQLADILVECGISRVSLGMQSLQPHVLETLDRRATAAGNLTALRQLLAAGCSNINVDLMWAIPGQTLAELRHDLVAISELAVSHISAYELELHPRAPLARRLAREAVRRDADVLDASYDVVVDELTAAGFAWYETSNFARDGQISRHNLAYWLGRDYVGIGVGAVSTVGCERRTNHANVVRYIEACEHAAAVPHRVEELDERLRRVEQAMLALRLDRPISCPANDDDDPVIDSAALDACVQAGLATIAQRDAAGCATSFQLTRRGRMLEHDVAARLLLLDSPMVAAQT